MFHTDIDKIIELLEKSESPRSKFVIFMDDVKDPFKVLVGCIMSLRTQDEVTYPASQRLFAAVSKPEDFLTLSEEEIQSLIYPVGFYKNKARQIKEICYLLVTRYNSKVPDTIEELLKFKGVGRKTANLVVAKGYNKPAICVDIHVHRIFNRIGYVETKTPDDTEMVLRQKLPKKYWLKVNDLMVTHGQNICRPVKPKCPICPINYYCAKII